MVDMDIVSGMEYGRGPPITLITGGMIDK